MWEGPKPTPETPTETTPETPTETEPETPTETTPETPTETTPETFQPVSATVLTDAAMDYLDVVVKEEILNKGKEKDNKKADRLSNMLNRALDGIKQKARKVFQDYFKEHPILKKSESKKMVFEIDDPSAFWNMFKEVYDKSVPRALKQIIPSDVTDKINDISKTLRDADVKTYKDIAFPHFWTLIQNAVKTEHWTMTVQTYYDEFSRAFPNRHDSQIARDLASSGQADKDIKVAELSSIS